MTQKTFSPATIPIIEAVASAYVTRKQTLPAPLPEDMSFLYYMH